MPLVTEKVYNYTRVIAGSVTPPTSAGEADLVIHHVKCLAAAGLCLRDIAVIAPYNLQVTESCRSRTRVALCFYIVMFLQKIA